MTEIAWLSTTCILKFPSVDLETPVYHISRNRDYRHNKNDWNSLIVNYLHYKISLSRPKNPLYILFLGSGIIRTVRMTEIAWLSTTCNIKFPSVNPETPVYSVSRNRDYRHNKNDWNSLIVNYLQYKISLSRPKNPQYILFLGTGIIRTVRMTEIAWLSTICIIEFPSVGPETPVYSVSRNRDNTHSKNDWNSLIVNYLH
jgi:hypothetical protein